MAMTAPSSEMEGVPQSAPSTNRANTQQGGGRARRHTDIIDVDANDSGNELSMGGSSSEGDSMSHHRGEHSPNHHHHDSLLTGGGGSQGLIQGTNTVFQPFTGSLFDTPPSLLHSPHQQHQFHQAASFSPSGFGGGMNDAFRCAVCSKIGRNGTAGVLQFVCAHKTCQQCCQMPPSNFDQHRQSCTLCGALPATAANFPPQMFLSPTLTTPPHGGGLLLDSSVTPISKTSTPQQAPRAFSFSLNGLPGSPSPIIPRMSTPVSAGVMMRTGGFPELETSWSPMMQQQQAQQGYHHHQAPPQLTIKNLPSIGNQKSLSNVFDSLSVNDDTPVFSPLSPTNTSSHMPPSLMASPEAPRHSAAIAPPRSSICSTPRLPATSSTSSTMTMTPNIPQFALQQQQFQMPPPLPPMAPIQGAGAPGQQQMPPIQCQGCEANVGIAFCMQCQEALCTHCIQAHQRVRATKQHAVVELHQLMATLMNRAVQVQQQQQQQTVQLMQNGGGGSTSSRQALGSVGSGDGHASGLDNDSTATSGESSPRSSSVCGQHESPIVGYCEHCPQSSASLCAICVPQHPSQHRVQPIGDIRMAVGELANESQLLQWQCDKTGDTIKRIIDGIVMNATTAENEIRTAFDTHVNALEERRKELLKRVETVKKMKLSVLISQSEHLKSKQIDLQNAILNAKNLMDAPDCDEQTLRQIFEQLTACQMCTSSEEPNNNMPNILMLACQVNEDDRLKFTAPQDGILLNKARQFGNIESGPCAKSSSIVGESYRKAIRERQTIIYVQLRDACGDLLSSSIAATQPSNQALLPHQAPHAHLDQSMPTADVQAFIIAPNGVPVDVGMTPRENGIVAISYFPTIEGTYNLNILVKGTSINNCPTTMEVRRGRNYDDIANKGPILTFGKEGSGDGELCRPWGICVDQRGRVIVADRSNNRVQIFDKDGNFLAKFGTSGNRPGQFDRPAGITTNTLNNIVVADKDNHRVQVFDENGQFLLKFGDRGRAVGYFNYPWGVATNSHNAIAVSDTRNHRVQIFTPQGQFVRKCGFDSAYFFKNLDSPRGLCYLPDGQLLITDFNNHRLAILSPRNMSEMKVYGSEGDADGMFVRPQGVVIDPEGHILVCDSRNNRIQVFASEDMRFIASFGLGPVAAGFQMPQELPAPYSSLAGPFGAPSFSSTPTPLTPSPRQLLDRPTDLAVGPDGRIYVVDFGNNCIRVF
ncbi:CBN-LIN-41 protein [Caenorhabditis brenneri]|uniref:CBN-LIN-41 protein n=1 Tax=Caenorhabditis brenneri TaxID=135651 RepID=G0MLY8_CAEBE|nr:CBN-LIN-41 protein [Caenorhabditis brenneri]